MSYYNCAALRQELTKKIPKTHNTLTARDTHTNQPVLHCYHGFNYRNSGCIFGCVLWPSRINMAFAAASLLGGKSSSRIVSHVPLRKSRWLGPTRRRTRHLGRTVAITTATLWSHWEELSRVFELRPRKRWWSATEWAKTNKHGYCAGDYLGLYMVPQKVSPKVACHFWATLWFLTRNVLLGVHTCIIRPSGICYSLYCCKVTDFFAREHRNFYNLVL